jgi:hypothetical protein
MRNTLVCQFVVFTDDRPNGQRCKQRKDNFCNTAGLATRLHVCKRQTWVPPSCLRRLPIS